VSDCRRRMVGGCVSRAAASVYSAPAHRPTGIPESVGAAPAGRFEGTGSWHTENGRTRPVVARACRRVRGVRQRLQLVEGCQPDGASLPTTQGFYSGTWNLRCARSCWAIKAVLLEGTQGLQACEAIWQVELEGGAL
jgi:hypothetical protein